MEKNCTKCKYITPIAGVDYGFCNHKNHLGRIATENTMCSEYKFKDKVDKTINEDLKSLSKPEITIGKFVTDADLATPPYVKYQIDDFIGSRANDGTAFAIGSRNSGTRLVFNYKGISALLLTKYGNFDLGAFDVSDNITELEFNGVLFKRVEKKENNNE